MRKIFKTICLLSAIGLNVAFIEGCFSGDAPFKVTYEVTLRGGECALAYYIESTDGDYVIKGCKLISYNNDANVYIYPQRCFADARVFGEHPDKWINGNLVVRQGVPVGFDVGTCKIREYEPLRWEIDTDKGPYTVKAPKEFKKLKNVPFPFDKSS